MLQPEPVARVLLGLVDLGLVELVRGDRIEALHADRHVAIRDALNLKLVHAAEIADLLEA
ncbi:hypothetical protein D3C72_2186090 [compost metagenome]